MTTLSNTQPCFIGRKKDIERLTEAFHRGKRFIQLTGMHAIGTSRTMRKFLSDNLSQIKNIKIWKILDFRNEECNLRNFVSVMKKSLELAVSEDDLTDTIELADEIKEKFLSNSSVTNVIFLDNTEGILKNEGCMRQPVLNFCVRLLTECPNVYILMTTTAKVCFSQVRSVVHTQDLREMDQCTSFELLRAMLSSEHLKSSEYLEPLAALCAGLPLVILMVASELEADDCMMEPLEMIEIMLSLRLQALSRDFYPEDDQIYVKYKRFIDKLKPGLQQCLLKLGEGKVQKSSMEAAQALGCSSTAEVKHKFLIALKRNHALGYDHTTSCFSINDILTECQRMEFAVSCPGINSDLQKKVQQMLKDCRKKGDSSQIADPEMSYGGTEGGGLEMSTIGTGKSALVSEPSWDSLAEKGTGKSALVSEPSWDSLAEKESSIAFNIAVGVVRARTTDDQCEHSLLKSVEVPHSSLQSGNISRGLYSQGDSKSSTDSSSTGDCGSDRITSGAPAQTCEVYSNIQFQQFECEPDRQRNDLNLPREVQSAQGLSTTTHNVTNQQRCDNGAFKYCGSKCCYDYQQNAKQNFYKSSMKEKTVGGGLVMAEPSCLRTSPVEHVNQNSQSGCFSGVSSNSWVSLDSIVQQDSVENNECQITESVNGGNYVCFDRHQPTQNAHHSSGQREPTENSYYSNPTSMTNSINGRNLAMVKPYQSLQTESLSDERGYSNLKKCGEGINRDTDETIVKQVTTCHASPVSELENGSKNLGTCTDRRVNGNGVKVSSGNECNEETNVNQFTTCHASPVSELENGSRNLGTCTDRQVNGNGVNAGNECDRVDQGACEACSSQSEPVPVENSGFLGFTLQLWSSFFSDTERSNFTKNMNQSPI